MSVPFPFKTIATAFAFSPYAEANLHESTRIAKMLDAELILIHVGVKTPDKIAQVDLLISQTEIDPKKVRIEFREGDPVKCILDSCKENRVNLLIAGAMKKENLMLLIHGSGVVRVGQRARR